MSPRLHKLIWSEGMYLAPHHFQAQSRFFEDFVYFATDCFWQHAFGFLGLEVNEKELRQGRFELHHIRGIMPDGLPFDVSEEKRLPAGRDITGVFPATNQALMLFLAVRQYREGNQNAQLENDSNGHSATRFKQSTEQLTDFNTGQDLKRVSLLKPDFRVVTQNEAGTDDVLLPMARILRDGKGQYLLDPTYVPPVLRVAANPRLQLLLERLLEILADKSHNLSERRRSGGDIRGDQRELVEFWLLHTVNSAIPVLRMMKSGRSPHPERFYAELSRLAGALCSFASNSDPADLPGYDHTALGDVFANLDQHVRRHLELGLPTRCVTIPMKKFQPLFFEGAITDPRCFGVSQWVLGIKSDRPETTLISQAPSLLKVSARDWIERVVRQAVPGAPLSYIPVPPASVPAHFGMVYFSVDQQHPLFEPIRKFKSVGVYVPGELVNPELELHVVIGHDQL